MEPFSYVGLNKVYNEGKTVSQYQGLNCTGPEQPWIPGHTLQAQVNLNANITVWSQKAKGRLKQATNENQPARETSIIIIRKALPIRKKINQFCVLFTPS